MSGSGLSAAEQLVVDAALGGTRITGSDLGGASIRGSLIRELLNHDHGPLHWRGIRLQHVHVAGDVDLSYCVWHGALRLLDCRIDGDIDLSYADVHGAIVLNRSQLRAIVAMNFRQTGSLLFRGGLAKRGLRGNGMTLTGVLDLDESTLVAPTEKRNQTAVGLYRAHIEDLYMTRSVLLGGFYGNGMTVRRNVRLSGMTARSRAALKLRTGPDTQSGYAVTMPGATIGGTLYLYSQTLETEPPRLDGGLDLDRVTCMTLQTRAADLAGVRLAVDHLTYERFSGIEPRQWLAILEGLPDLTTHPYRQLAAVCDADGQFVEARDVRIALQRRIDRESPGTWFNRVRRGALRYTVAYGYRAGFAVFWLVVVSLLAVTVLGVCNDFMIREAADGKVTKGFDHFGDAAAFTVDSLLPFARLGVTDAWSAHPSTAPQYVAAGLFVTLKGLAWALAALALAATTGLVRRD